MPARMKHEGPRHRHEGKYRYRTPSGKVILKKCPLHTVKSGVNAKCRGRRKRAKTTRLVFAPRPKKKVRLEFSNVLDEIKNTEVS
jgi:hypothetical protein